MPKQPKSGNKSKKMSKIDSEDMSDKIYDINLDSDSDGEQQIESECLGNVKRIPIPDCDSDVDPSKNALSDNDDDFDVSDSMSLIKPEYDSDGSIQFDVAKVLKKKSGIKESESSKSSKSKKNK
jgi:hypothetical protein